jgi:nitrous oxidase accessory protein
VTALAAILALSLLGQPGVATPPPGEITRRLHAAPDGATVLIPAGDIVEISAPGAELRGFTIRATGTDLDKENAAVRVLAPRVTLEDNTLEDVLFGIDLREAPDAVVRGNRIGGKTLDIARRGDGLRLWRSDRALIERNTLHDGRDAILWYSQDVVVRDNVSRRCRYGFHLMYSDNARIDSNDLADNSVGVYVMYSRNITLVHNRLLNNRGPSGYGIGLKEVDQFAIDSNLIAGNRVGIFFDGSPFNPARPALTSGNTLACNDVGIALLPAVRGNVFAANNFIDNAEQVAVQGRGQIEGNAFSRDGRGNYWSDYTGYDRDHDGIGDYAHEPQTLFESLIDKDPKLRVLLYSPSQQAVEFVARALPAVRPEPKFSDDWPLMSPVPASHPATAPARRLETAAAGLALLAFGTLLAFGARVTRRARPRTPPLAAGGAP